MIQYWATINDDELNYADNLSCFLQGEFCHPDTDQMWSSEYFRWKLGSSNPAGKGYVSLAIIDNQVVGSISITKKRMLIDGNEYQGAEIGDSYTSAAIRRNGCPLQLSSADSDPNSYVNKSIFGRLVSDVRSRAEADGISIIYGTPNANSYPGYVKRLGFFELKTYDNRCYIRPTSRFFKKKYPGVLFFSSLLHAADCFSIRLQKLIYSRLQGKSIVFETGAPSADDLDDLWSRLKPTMGFALIRDASYWRHRYLEHPIAQYTFHSVHEKNILVGVIVTRLFSVGDSRCVVSIAEWMNEPHIRFGYILSEIMDYYRNTGADFFNFWADESSHEARAAGRSLFFSRQNIPIILADTPQARSLQTMTANIKFYLGSTDNV